MLLCVFCSVSRLIDFASSGLFIIIFLLLLTLLLYSGILENGVVVHSLLSSQYLMGFIASLLIFLHLSFLLHLLHDWNE